MRQLNAILLIFVNLISSGLIEFAVNTCCNEEELSCCSPISKKESELELDNYNNCCCTDSESHFYYITAKYQNTDSEHEFASSRNFVSIENNYRSMESVLLNESEDLKQIYSYKFRSKPPAPMNVKYGVWII